MSTFADVISRSDASALMPEEVQREIVQGTEEKSAALQLFPHVPMSRAQTRIPVLSSLPTAYWVTPTDTGLKQTTDQQWSNKYLDAAEIAVIIPMPKSVMDDADYDVWGQVKPKAVEAFGVALDDAVFFAINKPSEWTHHNGILQDAITAGNIVESGTSSIDIADDINTAMGLVEADGFEVNGFWGNVTMRATLRGLRDKNNGLLFVPGAIDTGISQAPSLGMQGMLWGQKIVFSRSGLTGFSTAVTDADSDTSTPKLIMGDFEHQGLLGVRQDIEMQVFDTGVITDNTGAIVFNLMQQDMVALRITARYAFVVPNPINRQNTSSSTRYPFAVLGS